MNSPNFKALQDAALEKLTAYEAAMKENSSSFEALQESIENATGLREQFEDTIKKMRQLADHRDNIERLPERIQELARRLIELEKNPTRSLDLAVLRISQQPVQRLLDGMDTIKGRFSQTILGNLNNLGNNLAQDKKDLDKNKVELLEGLKTLANKRLSDLTNELQDSVSDELQNLQDELLDAVMELQDKIQTISEDLISFGTEEISTTLENSAALYDSLADIKQRTETLFEAISQMMETTNDGVQEAQTGLRLITDILMELDAVMEEIQ